MRSVQLNYVIGVMAIMAASCQADEIINDNMDFADYSVFTINEGGPDDNSFADWYQDSGGNPGESIYIEHYMELNRDENGEPPSGDGSVGIFSGVFNEDVYYNPFVEGAIASIDFSIDVLVDGSNFSGNVDFGNIGFGIQEVGGSGQANGFIAIETDAEWQTLTFTGYDEDYFLDFNDNASFKFGITIESAGDLTEEDGFLDLQLDNFVVNINAVPEPASASGLCVLGLALLGRRRRLS